MAGEFDDYGALGFEAEAADADEAISKASSFGRHHIDLDMRAEANGLGSVAARAILARGEIIEGGYADTMEDVQERAEEVVDRGTLSAPASCRGNATPVTVADRERFLANFAATGVWNQSAYDTGHPGVAFRRLSQEDPGFQLQVQEAIQDYRELLQMEIVRRGVRGMVKPVFGRGGKDCPDQIVGYVREFSDRLLELEAKAAWPKRYRDNIQPTDGRRYGVLVVPGTASPEDWQREALAALQKPVIARRKITKAVE